MVSGITKVARVVLVSAALTAVVHAGADPVPDYLKMFSPLGGGPRFFSDDTLLRLEVDLDGDAQNEVLLSIARDRNGKQGNGWLVYKKERGVFRKVGGVTFNDGSIFVGMVEELRRSGIVTFWSSGGGEGSLIAYTLQRGGIRETKIGALEWDQNAGRMRGQAAFERYFSEKQREVRPLAEEIKASEFGARYGVRVEPMTYSEFLALPAAQQEAISAPYTTGNDAPGGAPGGASQNGAKPASEPDASDPESSVQPGAALRTPKMPFLVGRDLWITGVLVGGLTVTHLILRARRGGGGR